jgi:two-component system sensor histidine kinase BaeS
LRIKLSYKIFAAFLITSLTIVSLTIFSLRYFVHRSFTKYVYKMEMERLSYLVDMLAGEYKASGGWGRLEGNAELWRAMVRIAGRMSREQAEGDAGDAQELHGTKELAKGPVPPPPGSPMESPPVPHSGSPPPPSPPATASMPPPLPPPPPRHEGHGLFEIRGRIFLLDAQKHLIAGHRDTSNNTIFQVITVDDKPIGYLGISRVERRLNPQDRAFLRRQNELFYLIGLGIFILTGFASLFLSRHLLTPIKKLTAGTRALTSRKLTTRIDVRSRDELGQLAADFNVMAHTLEQYEEMRKRWISDISHELRTPLSILRGELEAMQDGIREANRSALDSLHAEVVHLGKIVDDLHELTMADAGALHMEKMPVDPIEVLEASLGFFRTRFEQTGLEVELVAREASRMLMLGDAGRLAQLYSNILENTLRYTDAPGKLKISASRSRTELSLAFDDTGPGVPQESMDRLFDRLYRLDSSRTRGKGGSGLGLAICKAIVENHQGRISAAGSRLGGLRIEVVLPILSMSAAESRR